MKKDLDILYKLLSNDFTTKDELAYSILLFESIMAQKDLLVTVSVEVVEDDTECYDEEE